MVSSALASGLSDLILLHEASQIVHKRFRITG
jgi:hypothetical protein